MFSSKSDESSLDGHLSFFTRSIAECVGSHPQDSILYKDVVYHLSDDFAARQPKQQTPRFVTQGGGMDLFCTITPTMRRELGDILNQANTSSAGKQTSDAAAPESEENGTPSIGIPPPLFTTKVEWT